MRAKLAQSIACDNNGRHRFSALACDQMVNACIIGKPGDFRLRIGVRSQTRRHRFEVDNNESNPQ
jgi:hypothetical protein